MLELLGVLLLLGLIGLSIGLHEVGHLLPAKKFGVKVTEFAIGFGPAVWKSKWGETDLRLRLFPVGGFVRMIGMYAPARLDGRRVGGWFADQVLDAREASVAELEPGEEHRAFYKLSTPKRLGVMIGGPAMNLLFAVVLFGIALSGIGVEMASNGVAQAVACVPTVADPEGTAADCLKAPAAQAGIRAGDTIVAIDGVSVSDWQGVRTALGALEPGDQAAFSLRDVAGETRIVSLTLADATYEVLGADGKPTGEVGHRAFAGLAPASTFVRMPLTAIPGVLWNLTTSSVSALMSFPAMVGDLAVRMVTGQSRDPMGPVSVVGVTRLGGEIVASEMSPASKAFEILAMAGSLNLFLFLFNLVPLLPLDGGHAAGAVFESVRRRWAAMRSRPDPGPVDVARLLPLSYVTSILLLASGLLVVFADIFSPISLGG